MNRVIAFAVAILCCEALVGCTDPATETTVSRVAPPQATSAVKAAKGAGESLAETHEVRKEVAEAKDATTVDAPGIPKVFLTSEDSAMCRVRTGEQLPAISLPQHNGGEAELAKLQGKQATVVLFWGDDPWMSETALADLAQLGASDDVAVVGIAVKLANNEVQAATGKAGAKFPQLSDAAGKAFNQVGMTKLPQVYVLNESGEIVWFDIEYSQSTARELKQTLDVLTSK
jgi:peroxiredoxin